MNKIFRMNDREWWAGPSLEKVKAQMSEDYGTPPEGEAWWDEEARELTAEEMETLTFRDEEECDEEGNPIKRSFREQLARYEAEPGRDGKPHLFAADY